jgi:hypothetical protein
MTGLAIGLPEVIAAVMGIASSEQSHRTTRAT